MLPQCRDLLRDMVKPLRSHRELKVYQNALIAANKVFRLTLRFPSNEKFALVPQARNSSRAVLACLAEAVRKRRYARHWISKLSDCESEAAETQVWMEVARDCGYITDAEFDEIFDNYDEILGQLVNMAAHPEKWCVPTERR